MNIQELHVGELYSNAEIQSELNVGNAGGIRVRLTDDNKPRRMVLLTSKSDARLVSENPYCDRIENDFLVYTGGGREGDQSLAGVNKRIPQQLVHDFPIYGFEIIRSRRSTKRDPKRWRFLGLLEYVRHYPETQVDVNKQVRQVWLFEFRIHAKPAVIAPAHDSEISSMLLTESRMAPGNEMDERELAVITNDGPTCDSIDPVEVERERSQLLSLSPERFEHLIKDVLELTGFQRVSVTQYSQDGGIDINAYSGREMWPIKDLLIQVQAKRWLHTVGRREVAQLRGSLEPFARGTLVTTSHFSKAAITEAKQDGRSPIVLVDGFKFASLVLSLRPRIDLR